MKKDIKSINQSELNDFEEFTKLIQYLIDKTPKKIKPLTDEQIEAQRIRVENIYKERRVIFEEHLKGLGINPLNEDEVEKKLHEIFQELRDKWFENIEQNPNKLNIKKTKYHKQKFFE